MRKKQLGMIFMRVQQGWYIWLGKCLDWLKFKTQYSNISLLWSKHKLSNPFVCFIVNVAQFLLSKNIVSPNTLSYLALSYIWIGSRGEILSFQHNITKTEFLYFCPRLFYMQQNTQVFNRNEQLDNMYAHIQELGIFSTSGLKQT